MAKVELKQPVVAEIAELLDGAQGAVLVDYRGLTVEQDTELRKQLREAGISYKVYKNTMIRFAAKGPTAGASPGRAPPARRSILSPTFRPWPPRPESR